MEHIGKHISAGPGRSLGRTSSKERATERGELMQYFLERLNRSRVRDGLRPLTMGRLGRLFMAMSIQDLYYLKSICDDAEARNGLAAFSKKFWWEVSPKKHPEDKVVIKKPTQ